MNKQPLIIRKHWFGLFLIYLQGALGVVALLLAAYEARVSDLARGLALGPLLLAGLVVGVFTFVRSYVYSASRLTISAGGVTVLEQLSLFGQRQADMKIGELEDVSFTRTSVAAALFNYGTLIIQDAAARNTLVFPMTPRPAWLKDYIEASDDYLAAHN